jgi:hypothetical protein
MAKRILNRKELRAQNDEAEEREDGDDEKAEKKVKKAPAKRKSRAKTPKEVRLKAFWGVFNQSMKVVTKFEYNERKYADKKVAELNAAGKAPHFVQLIKEVIEE